MNKEFESIKQGIKESFNGTSPVEQVDTMRFGRPQLTKEDFDDMEKAIKVGRGQSDWDTITMTNCEGQKVEIQYPWDSDIYDMMEIVMRLLIASSYSPEVVKNGFYYMANEFYGESEEGKVGSETNHLSSKQ